MHARHIQGNGLPIDTCMLWGPTPAITNQVDGKVYVCKMDT